MDPSALIFIALAVAWAIYLIPKALEHHEESVRTRTVEKFSATMRVLARREPVSRREARLVRTGSSSSSTGRLAPPAPDSQPVAPGSRPRRTANARAAQRRLRVVILILLAVAIVIALAAFHVVAWTWVAAPAGVLLAWLVACRLMVRRERRVRRSARPRSARPLTTAPAGRGPDATVVDPADDPDSTGPIDAVPASVGAVDATDPDGWDPVPVTLPTYVSKPVAPRSVRTIDLDATGVWSSGRSESDSELVREADAREADARKAEGREQTGTGTSQRRHA